MRNHESDREYLESWSDELIARASRVRQLIGDRHWLTDGHHKEVIVREFLTRYLPTTLDIGSGFIKSLDGGSCSPEVDILISDCSKHPAYFNEGGIQILSPSSTIAYLEMKSSFGSSSLCKALSAVSNTQLSLKEHKNKVWRGICFATVDKKYPSFQKTVHEKLTELISSLEFNTAQEVIERLPTCISSFESYLVFISKNDSKNSVCLNYFDLNKLSISVTFIDLFEHVRSHFGNNQLGELSEIVESLPSNGHNQLTININNA